MIFGIGLPKTGTTSLYAALNYLGFAVITWRHMRELGLAAWRQGDFGPDYLAASTAPPTCRWAPISANWTRAIRDQNSS